MFMSTSAFLMSMVMSTNRCMALAIYTNVIFITIKLTGQQIVTQHWAQSFYSI